MDEIREKYGVTYVKVNYDPWSSPILVAEMERRGYTKASGTLNPVRQWFSTLSIPTQLCEQWLKQKKLVYQGNPVTRWMYSNCELTQDKIGNVMATLTLQPLTLFYSKESTNIIISVVTASKAYPYTYPYSYGGGTYGQSGRISNTFMRRATSTTSLSSPQAGAS